ncbi:GDSL-type esterase/lipase family protein [Paenibacillus chondroitinus]|uniref:GDSL-type esterase/lipase family protein n=1 Tax=Paenibacillus chondroitinus TaxID=59842 RepID=A0ABU6DDE9_9BACL|nr:MULTISPECIES: GDSL-type esterase/lipase family protein [Paenibacillus]MCY9656498.1 GDSL-type esterase/lipase family protein [Paenibacillus anseongense]MEB4795322.1 GDSL-type esterase/lipase family protein [Paenibacillus chondroitinus]
MQELFPRKGLPNVIQKLANGEAVTIVYFGGSNTRSEGYRVMTADWLRGQYPKADIRSVNAGIDGTGSDLACARLETDVLRHQPDLVFVEFVGNDGGVPESKARIEGIVRQIRKRSRFIDILFVYTLKERDVAGFQSGEYQKGALMQEEVADYYGIPSIHLGVAVSQLVSEGKLMFTSRSGESGDSIPGVIVFTHDAIHPIIPEGHRIYTDTITRSFERIRALGVLSGSVEHNLPQNPLVPANPWEYAAMLSLDGHAHLSAGWSFVTPDDFALARKYDWLFPGLWRAVDPGEAITVQFQGTHIGLFDIGGPDSGRLKVTVDRGEPFLVDRFTPYNDHNRNQYVFLPELPNGNHTVRFEIDNEKTDKAAVFEASGNERSREHVQQHLDWYNQTVIQLGKLLVVQPPV